MYTFFSPTFFIALVGLPDDLNELNESPLESWKLMFFGLFVASNLKDWLAIFTIEIPLLGLHLNDVSPDGEPFRLVPVRDFEEAFDGSLKDPVRDSKKMYAYICIHI
jgi:hypothetical protein